MTIAVEHPGELTAVTIDRPEARNAVNSAMAAAAISMTSDGNIDRQYKTSEET